MLLKQLIRPVIIALTVGIVSYFLMKQPETIKQRAQTLSGKISLFFLFSGLALVTVFLTALINIAIGVK